MEPQAQVSQFLANDSAYFHSSSVLRLRDLLKNESQNFRFFAASLEVIMRLPAVDGVEVVMLRYPHAAIPTGAWKTMYVHCILSI